MFKVIRKKVLSQVSTLMEIEAPSIASKAKAGNFIIYRLDEHGERVPLTVAATDKHKGTVTIIFDKAGASTEMLDRLKEGDSILDFVGPLGMATHIEEDAKKVCLTTSGVGSAVALPIAKAYFNQKTHVDIIASFKTKDLVILEDEMKKASNNLYIMTDDGSYGEQGFATVKLKSLIDGGAGYDSVVTIGAPIMMKYVAETTRPYGIETVASLNPIMIDGTGMCGCCRVNVGGKTKFACVDGPEFDAHLIDFDSLMLRNSFYIEEEQRCNENCRLKS